MAPGQTSITRPPGAIPRRVLELTGLPERARLVERMPEAFGIAGAEEPA